MLSNGVRTTQFKIFRDVASARSLTLAGEKNDISESAVSQMLQKLESQFETRFAERNWHMFRLTPAGEIFNEHAEKIALICDQLDSHWEKMAQTVSNLVRLVTTPYIGLHYLPPLLKRFEAEHPQANLQVEYRRPGQIFEEVLDYKADLGLAVSRIKEPRLEFIPFGKEPLVLICHPQHPFAGRRKSRLDAFQGHTWISFERGFPNYTALASLLRRCDVKQRRIIQFNEIEPIKRAVAIGEGVAIVPEIAVRGKVAEQTLAALSIADGDFYHPFVAVRNPLKKCTPMVKHFISLLKEARKPVKSTGDVKEPFPEFRQVVNT